LRGVTNPGQPYANTSTSLASGSQNVKEISAEVNVPLAKNLPLLHSLSVTGAARFTDYSTSGSVWTWKGGIIWDPIADIRIRAAASRDIRAPSLFDLYAGGNAALGGIIDPHCNCFNPVGVVLGGGNANLQPEKADGYNVGVVFTPRALPSFTASVDFYHLKISDAITQLTATQILTYCEQSNGTSSLCSLVTRPGPFSDHSTSNVFTSVFAGTINAASLVTRGLDVSAQYQLPADSLSHLMKGDFNFGAVGSYVDQFDIQPFPGGATQPLAGYTDGLSSGPVPHFRGTLSLDYKLGAFNAHVQGRYISTLKTGDVYAYEEKELPQVWYVDTTLTYRVPVAQSNLDVFVTVNNLLNRQPPLFPGNAVPSLQYPTIQQLYDVMGRYFTAGVRIKF
jgi:outer membrane receptor protein involved in Fe transport